MVSTPPVLQEDGYIMTKTKVSKRARLLADQIAEVAKEINSLQPAVEFAEEEEAKATDRTNRVAMGGMARYLNGILERYSREHSRLKWELVVQLSEEQGLPVPVTGLDLDKLKSYPILELIKSYTKVDERRSMALCPIHKETVGSLKIYPNTNSWYCFGCNNGGSVIDFVKEVENVTVSEAIKILKNVVVV